MHSQISPRNRHRGSFDKWFRVSSFVLVALTYFGLVVIAKAGAQNYDPSNASLPCNPQGESLFSNRLTGRGAGDVDSPRDVLGSDGPSTMSSGQVEAILHSEPTLLTNIKVLTARRSGTDPTSISDQSVFECVERDPDYNDLVAAELTRAGYVANADRQSGGPGSNGYESPGHTPLLTDKASESTLPGPARRPPFLQPHSDEQSEPLLMQAKDPYLNVPSLKDLYAQIQPDSQKLRRFGSDTFRMGTGNASELPMDLPVGPDYVLGPGDSLIINIWGGQSGRINREVDRQGMIALPEAGTTYVAGLTIDQAQAALRRSLGAQFQRERVEISLGRVRTVRVYVVGDVQKPGAYDISALSTVLNALYAAGGPTGRGSLRTLQQYRGRTLIHEVDLYDFLLRGVHSDVERLLPGDTILVPPVGPQVAISGMVRRPAIYELKGEQSLEEAIELAGGIQASGSTKQIRVERIEEHKERTMLSAQISDAAGGQAAAIPKLKMQDGDKVFVSPILPYNEDVVYLDGHVYRPGRYPWRDGMTVTDLLHSFQDVMPEPADHAEIIRLEPPDLHPETITFDLPDELMGNDAITLRPFDVIRIFSRYEIDSPKVTITGEVLRPGEYPLSQGMTAVGLVKMAGGFRRSAYTVEADLSSYQVKDTQRILTHHSVIAISKALAGDRAADEVLKPGDVLGIRQITGWKDIGASVVVDGEVRYAGSYGIEDGERLSTLLKRVGGFRESAYPEGAVLDRIQVREAEEQSRQEMIRRIESTAPMIKAGISSTQDQQNLLQVMQQQRDQALAALRSHPSTGRMVIRISSDIGRWENTPADIEMRAGDRLRIPKRPDFVIVSGQVYNATGLTFVPGKNAGWYLNEAGGVTRAGDKRQIFIVRADGSVGAHGDGMLGSNVLNVRLHRGDAIVVPERAVGGSQLWRDLIGAAQIMSSVAITGAAAGIF